MPFLWKDSVVQEWKRHKNVRKKSLNHRWSCGDRTLDGRRRSTQPQTCFAPLRRHNVNWPKMGIQPKPWFTIYRIVYTSTFFSNGRISGTKRDFVNALVANRSQRTGLSSPLSWKWPRPTLSSSFGLFFEREHFFGVFQVGQSGPLWPKTCPWDPMASPKRFRKFPVKIERFP